MKTIFAVCVMCALTGTICHQSADEKGDVKASYSFPDRNTLDEQTRTVLEKWQNDSVGCLMLRTADDGYYLAETFKLDGASRQFVEKILGKPNEVRHEKTWVKGITYDDAYRIFYYCHSHCRNDNNNIMFESWIEVVIPGQKDSVVAIKSGIK